MSEGAVPFVPSAEVCYIDLTTEPSTPANSLSAQVEEEIRYEGDEQGHPVLESDLDLPTSPPNFSKVVAATYGSCRHIDVPIVPTLSSQSEGSECHTTRRRRCEPTMQLPWFDQNSLEAGQCSDDDSRSFFEDEFAATLDGHCSAMRSFAEQESFDPLGSTSRVIAPVMDFLIPPPSWSDSASSPSTHLTWLQGHVVGFKSRFPIIQDRCIDGIDQNLTWAPIPTSTRRVVVHESIRGCEEVLNALMHLAPLPGLCINDPRNREQGLLLIRDQHEEFGLDSDTEAEPEIETVSAHFGQDLPSSLDHKSLARSHVESPKTLEALIAGREKHDAPVENRPLLLSSVASNNADLLSRFMELRAIRKPRLASSNIASDTETERHEPNKRGPAPSVSKTECSDRESLQHLVKAPAPKLALPQQKGVFMISVSLKRSILRSLEASWPHDQLLDRDNSAYVLAETDAESYASKNISDRPIDEADITLTPAVGIIVTTLLRAKQRPLPTSRTLPPLRQRLIAVSQKYETLYVLISESNPAGDYLGSLSGSDLAAYSEFVRFACALDSGVITVLVAGSDGTMSKYILSLMGQHSPYTLDLKRFINTTEST